MQDVFDATLPRRKHFDVTEGSQGTGLAMPNASVLCFQPLSFLPQCDKERMALLATSNVWASCFST